MEGASCSVRWSQQEDITFQEYQLIPRGDTPLILHGTVGGRHMIYLSAPVKRWALVTADLGCKKVIHGSGYSWEQRPSTLILSGFDVIEKGHGGVLLRSERGDYELPWGGLTKWRGTGFLPNSQILLGSDPSGWWIPINSIGICSTGLEYLRVTQTSPYSSVLVLVIIRQVQVRKCPLVEDSM